MLFASTKETKLYYLNPQKPINEIKFIGKRVFCLFVNDSNLFKNKIKRLSTNKKDHYCGNKRKFLIFLDFLLLLCVALRL